MTGGLFPLLGSVVAVTLGAVEKLDLSRLALVILGGFIAHWLLTHTIHDLLHFDEGDAEGKRQTLSKKSLKGLMILSLVPIVAIAR